MVVLSRYRGKILLSRHKDRDTWETQGGHIEPGETPLEAARRELRQESIGGVGAIRVLPIIGQIEGHYALPENQKGTGYEHMIPRLVELEQDA